MTTQQMNYMRYQQMRQSAMRAYVAGMAKAQDPVPPVPPPPPPVTTWHVSLSAVYENTGTPLGAEVSLREYSAEGEPGEEIKGDGSVEIDIQPGNRVRASGIWLFPPGTLFGPTLSEFDVNGTRRSPTLAGDYSYVDVTPDSDRTEISAVYMPAE